MNAYFEFLIRASVYLFILGGAYLLLFRGNRRPVFNRFFILLSFVVSVGLASVGPMDLAWGTAGENTGFVMNLPEVLVGAEVPALTQNLGYSLASHSGWILPALFMALLALLLGLRVAKINQIIRSNTIEKAGSIRLVLLKENHAPFSFFRWIFIPMKVKDTPHFEKIITHEKAHYACGHSWDLMLMEAMRLLLFFHPLYYILKRELQNMHEFEADSHALRQFSRTDYQKALLDFAMGGAYIPITNPFNISVIQKRFVMMNSKNTQSLKVQFIKLFAILPLVGIAFFIQSCNLHEQQQLEAEAEVEARLAQQEELETDVIFTIVEQQPSFPGGDQALMQFLSDNLTYPTAAREAGIQGVVFVSFVVEKNGQLSNIRILRGIEGGGSLEQEAIRVISAMPAWNPGMQRGEAVRVQFNLPIRFVLNPN